MHALYLFDIDGTLLITRGLGIRAMELAGQDLFGPTFTIAGVDFAGSLDPLLFDELIIRNSVAETPATRADFRRRYAHRLTQLLAESPAEATALPGIAPLLASLSSDPRVILGLLTGNFAETGCLKLRHCGIDPEAFHLHVWGDESPHPRPSRDHLPAVAHHRMQARGRAVPPRHTVVIGDTPHDIRCAAANHCRAAAVATGKYSVAELRAAGADHVFDDLADTPAVLDALARLAGLTAESAALPPVPA